ncbi:zinc finger protein 835-like [Strongylocentrotus purpuratus]|uniref:C2H2-type domain-containing protein n=1 Tax=Strongylocentrotus purpuratus TaxID=7668 RepID=A0A7M7HLQ8_STRPU|nr:zinc finger protein 835-like [Strongylocentrotus purpuratus]
MESTPLLANPLRTTLPVFFPVTGSATMPIPVEIHEPDFNKAIASVITARHRRQPTSSIFNCHVSNCPLCQATRAPDRPLVEGKRSSRPQQVKASETDQPSVVNWLIPSSTPTPSLVADRRRASSKTSSPSSSPPRKRSTPSPPPSPDQRFQCPSCPESFAKKIHLRLHRRVHTGYHVYCCQDCPMLFDCPSSLIRHRPVHTGERPYRCSFGTCERDFRRRCSLNRHYKMHFPVPDLRG